jgi:hypothetical protein
MTRSQLDAELLKVLLRFFREQQHWDACVCHDDGAHADSIEIRALLAKLETLPSKKTATITLDSVKDPDGWPEVISGLGLRTYDEEGEDVSSKERQDFVGRHFPWDEYADLELVIDEDLNVVGGRVIPCREAER